MSSLHIGQEPPRQRPSETALLRMEVRQELQQLYARISRMEEAIDALAKAIAERQPPPSDGPEA